MGIDGIGRGGGLPPGATGMPGADGVASKEGASKPFEASRVEGADRTARAATTEGVSPESPLGRLRSGAIDVDGYVDAKVDEATVSLNGLSSAELEDIKGLLRDQVRSDPAFAELVRSATGKLPTPPEE